VNLRSGLEGDTPLMLACSLQSDETVHFPESFSASIVRELIRYGAKVNLIGHKSGETALVKAIKAQNRSTVDVLIEHQADVNLGQPKPLTVACATMRPDIVHSLLEAGADVNARVSKNETTLQFICSYDGSNRSTIYRPPPEQDRRTYSIIKQLIQYGAAVNDDPLCDLISLVSPPDENEYNFVGAESELSICLLYAAGATRHAPPHWCVDMCLVDFAGPAEISLITICRRHIRRKLLNTHARTNLFMLVPKLPLPNSLRKFLLFDLTL